MPGAEPVTSPRIRLVETRVMRAGDLAPNPLNWRIHPQSQIDVLRDSIRRLGFMRPLEAYINEAGAVQLVDGHARQALDEDWQVPVNIYDVDEQEARLYLAIADPIAALNENDDDQLARLLASVNDDDGPLANLLRDMVPDTGSPIAAPSEFTAYDEDIETEHRCPKCGYEWSGGSGEIRVGEQQG